MYSYNNIIEKGEPKNKECIDHALDDIFVRNPSELHAVQRQVHPSVDCIMVESFLTPAECDALLATCDEVGYSFWRQHTHEATDGEATCDASAKAVRMVDTIEANFPALSKLLYERISSVVELLPKSFSAEMENADALYDRELDGSWAPYALAENLLLGRYYPGGHFMPHIDGSTVVDINTRSFYTLLIYLNDCPAGGETFLFNGEQHEVMFLDPVSGKYRGRSERRCGEVRPQKGAAAFFYYDLLHEGAPVVEGLKYICRADLLYRRNPPILTSESDQKAFELYQAARIAEGNGEAMRACDMFRQVRRISPGVAHFYQLD